MPLDSTMWDLVRDRLAPIDVVTVDAPGFGGSPSGEHRSIHPTQATPPAQALRPSSAT